MKNSQKPAIIFMGTADFAVPSLDMIFFHGFPVIAVVTAVDKPAGRGREVKPSPVKKFAMDKGIPLLQPASLKDENFIKLMKSLNADLFVVVAFRMLPKEVWKIPPQGTFNLHASLLPQYRGAAPINWAIINGATQTGVTTFFIDEKIDTGKIIGSKAMKIEPEDNAGSLHDKLKILGAELVLETVKKITMGSVELKDQDQLACYEGELKKAPKIYREDCRINWEQPVNEIHNFIRGLSPEPGAFTAIESPEGKTSIIKIICSEITDQGSKHQNRPPVIFTDNKRYLRVGLAEGILGILELQQEGKKKLKIEEFLRGFRISENWKVK